MKAGIYTVTINSRSFRFYAETIAKAERIALKIARKAAEKGCFINIKFPKE